MLYWTWISFIGFPILKFVKPLEIFSWYVLVHLPATDPWSNGEYSRYSIMRILLLDLGSDPLNILVANRVL